MTKFINDLPELTATYLHEQFRYDPETGLLTWIAKRQGVSTGSFAGRQRHGSDSAHVALNKFLYPVELLVWVMRRGSWPTHIPYHLDRNRLNNRIDNLALPVGAQQVKPLRQRSMPHVLARIDAAHNAGKAPEPVRLTATDIAAALAPRKRNNRGRKAATVAVTMADPKAAPPSALETMRLLLRETKAELELQRENPPDMHPEPENIAGRAAVIEYTRKVDNIEARIHEMERKLHIMEEQDAQDRTVAPEPQPVIKGASVLAGLFAKALGHTSHGNT